MNKPLKIPPKNDCDFYDCCTEQCNAPADECDRAGNTCPFDRRDEAQKFCACYE